MRLALLVVLLAATADAKPKPPLTKAQTAAIKLATDWLAALPNNATAKLTAKPFFAVIYGEEDTPCPPSDNPTCLHDKLAPKGKPHLWQHTLGGPLAAQAKRLADKAAIVVELDEGCDGTENQTLVVVKGKLVAAVLAQTATCSE